MDAIILNGSLKHQHHLTPIQNILAEELGRAGWRVEPVLLSEGKIGKMAGKVKKTAES